MKKINEYSFIVEKTGEMRVPLVIYANDTLIKKMERDNSISQGINVATCLPGILEKSIMLPDAHRGYGFSIGGTAAMDSESGCLSPGGVGFDINCGVRLLVSDIDSAAAAPEIPRLLDALFRAVPSGVGSESAIRLSGRDMDEVLSGGVSWCLKNSLGTEDDAEFCEDRGRMNSADPGAVSSRAKERGLKQLGTLGAGNHFLEVQALGRIFDAEAAEVYGISKPGQVAVMIHCGSRGLGHQVCSDYLREFEDSYPDVAGALPEKDLIYAPALSAQARNYYAAMSSSANFAWANRHIIGHSVRECFREVFGKGVSLRTVYDVAHNIAKLEEHSIGGRLRRVYVHRKGATRAFAPGHPDIPQKYRSTGQPVLIPGSMGTASYLLRGTEKAMTETFGSSAHGAGRELSRFAAKKRFRPEAVREELGKRNIAIRAASFRGISEEAPGAYKDISEVISVTHNSGIALKVAEFIPLGVIKG